MKNQGLQLYIDMKNTVTESTLSKGLAKLAVAEISLAF